MLPNAENLEDPQDPQDPVVTTRPVRRTPGARAVVVTGAAALLGSVVLTGCGSGSQAQGAADAGRLVFVEASADDCQLSKRGSPPGDITFTVRNSGDRPVVFAVTSAASESELGSVEVGSDQLVDLVVPLPTGDFVTLCTPGGVEEPVTQEFAVTDADPSGGF